jgi:hypothetical protein
MVCLVFPYLFCVTAWRYLGGKLSGNGFCVYRSGIMNLVSLGSLEMNDLGTKYLGGDDKAPCVLDSTGVKA